jgi:hypothetical protein
LFDGKFRDHETPLGKDEGERMKDEGERMKDEGERMKDEG